MNLSSVWDDLSLDERKRLLSYMSNVGCKVDAATLPFVKMRDAWMATPISDDLLLWKLWAKRRQNPVSG